MMNEDLLNLTLIELLERLEPVPEPLPVSMWPQTVGWLWLAIVIAVGGAAFFYRWYRTYRTNLYRRAALHEIAAAGDDPTVLATILRRTALIAFNRRDVAGLYGDAWLSFLDMAYGGKAFSTGIGRMITAVPYGVSEAVAEPVPGLAALVADWVRQHDLSKGYCRQ